MATVVENDIVLPEYVAYKPKVSDHVPEMLRDMAVAVEFPLSDEDRTAMETLSLKFDREGNCAGLAAPQIGISKRIIVFATPDTPELRIWRPDLSDVMSSVWINPSYVGNEEAGFHADYEGCFSVEGVAGLVQRYKEIHYTAYNVDGEQLQGTIRGYLARLVQHEIDHLNGVLFSDMATNMIPMEEYRQMRLEAIARGYR